MRAASGRGTKGAATVRVPVVLDEDDLQEDFVKGSGPGGQKINKVRNNVVLRHTPTGVTVRCQRSRSLSENRKMARTTLRLKLDEMVNGAVSTLGQRSARAVRRKKKAASRARKKYGDAASGTGEAA